ncbi:MAG: tail fiber domain-containing protein [Dysgonamonadaceae bacterium]|jgi:hypothetical protein|nr:tail fiber domain-containing protein [Dysgonamonadaceae bacterium]
MKTIQKFLLAGFLLLCYAAANAQIKVDADGRVLVGPALSTNDPEKAAILEVFGKSNSQYASGGKLTFGDFGRQANNGWNVFIGEYGTTDTDQLWLHGKQGTFFTYNNGNSIWGYYNANVGNAFYFNCDVYSNGILLTSDDRRKENIRPLSGSLLSLQQLKGVSYSLKKPGMQVSANTQKADGKMSDKERQQIINVQAEKINALEKAIETLQGKSLSLIALNGKGADTKPTGLTK